MWLIAFLCLASAAGGDELEAQCSADEGVSRGHLRAQAIIISVMTVVIISLAYILFCLKKSLETLKGELQSKINNVVDPILYRVIDLECNDNRHREGLDLLRREAAEARGDLNILFRAVRQASPHPDEPSSQRRRFSDRRPPEAEPDQEDQDHRDDSPEPASETLESMTEDEVDRLWNAALRSRSRDDSVPHEPHGEDGEEEGPEHPSEFDEDDEAAAFPYEAPEVFEMRAERARADNEMSLMVHYMLIQANNLGVHLHTEGQIYSEGRIPFGRVEQLYVAHAPFLPLPPDDPNQETFQYIRRDGTMTFTWKLLHDEPIEFQSLEGLHGYRCQVIIAHRDLRLSHEERQDRLRNQLQYYRRI